MALFGEKESGYSIVVIPAYRQAGVTPPKADKLPDLPPAGVVQW